MISGTEGEYKVVVTGPGLKVEKPVEETIALTVLQVVMGGKAAAAAAQMSPQAVPQNERRQRLSLREFLEDVAGKSIPTKIVAIGRYLRDHEDQPDFSRDDIKGRFRTAGESPPANLPRDFVAAVGAGWIAEDPANKGRYYVTRRGDEAADKKFAGSSPTVSKGRRRRPSDGQESGDD